MNDRIPLDHLNSDQYDELCEELAALRQVSRGYCPACGRGDAGPTVEDWEEQRQRAEQAEELLRIAHDTSNKSEAERARAVQRAETAERDAEIYRKRLARLTDGYAEQFRRLETAEAAIARVRAECDALDRDRATLDNESFGDGYADAAARIRIALDGSAPAAATQATDSQEQEQQ